MTSDVNDGADAQDQAEVFDETNITRDGEDIAHPDMARDVLDVTSEDEDSEPFEGDDADFDPGLADEAELEAELDLDDGVDEARVFAADDADRVTSDDASPADYEADDLSDEDLAALGYADAAPDTHDPHTERALDQGLEETFPASDPVSISVGAN